jgi:hypothetical protein
VNPRFLLLISKYLTHALICYYQNQGHKASRTHHLILVAGHSVTISGHLQDAGSDESDWYVTEINCSVHV